MGVFYEAIMLIGADVSTELVRGMVDTGAMFTVVPASVLRRLELSRLRKSLYSSRLEKSKVGSWERSKRSCRA